MTLKELAKLAGVSVSTVSRVVNKNDVRAASEEVRNKIWDLVHQTGYFPNSTAQDLKLGAAVPVQEKNRSIACLFARTAEGKSDPFFSQIYHAIEHECMKNRYDVIGVYSASDFKNISQRFSVAPPDGMIVLGRYSRTLVQLLKNSCKNVVYTGLNAINDPYDQIICDGYKAAKTAVWHLYMLGHRSIGYIGEKSLEARYRGYYDAMQELRLPIVKEHVVESEQSLNGGYLSGLKILTATRPTAIFCANDITAIGVMKALSEQGIGIPSDISVIGIDNTEMCQYSSPTLTSIHIPKEDLGKFTVKTMIDRIEGGHQVPIKIEIPYTLISRDSCAPLKKG
ncbi:LacI family DNA-binding transcriptional regulator [Caproiciproducens faecalis]|uniref:LacI family DNA-binding transcriptional regulator n=1 Tax=Caproiciproducens faecalis TaxID=2820301 RepID=A0ABS7DMC1_9FIRM|nr:LacI family DNA-binding transcriptional regulator [Caproiciproducens faecalis]MBW7572363.1 LacI family DNA-binding transcriptional regulator [Caproiciproducens faecalis]